MIRKIIIALFIVGASAALLSGLACCGLAETPRQGPPWGKPANKPNPKSKPKPKHETQIAVTRWVDENKETNS